MTLAAEKKKREENVGPGKKFLGRMRRIRSSTTGGSARNTKEQGGKRGVKAPLAPRRNNSVVSRSIRILNSLTRDAALGAHVETSSFLRTKTTLDGNQGEDAKESKNSTARDHGLTTRDLNERQESPRGKLDIGSSFARPPMIV